MNIDLTNKLALVTGGSGELGRVMVRTMARCGASLAIHYHTNESMAARLCDEMKSQSVRAACFCADITDESSVNAMKDAVEKSLGQPDIIVNNAVVQYPWKNVLDQ